MTSHSMVLRPNLTTQIACRPGHLLVRSAYLFWACGIHLPFSDRDPHEKMYRWEESVRDCEIGHLDTPTILVLLAYLHT
jgi:hypothetical protein